jgi:hypothetical protein
MFWLSLSLQQLPLPHAIQNKSPDIDQSSSAQLTTNVECGFLILQEMQNM